MAATMIATTGATIAGCAHGGPGSAIEAKLAQEKAVGSSVELRESVRKQIEESPHLSAEQKEQLLVIKLGTMDEMDRLLERSLSLKGALLKDLVSDTYTPREEQRLKTLLEENERSRLSVFFNALRQADDALGRRNPDRERVMRAFWLDRPL